MKVLTTYKFYDDDVQAVRWNGFDSVREIVLKEKSLLLSKDDVIALVNEFGLVAYDRNSRLKPTRREVT